MCVFPLPSSPDMRRTRPAASPFPLLYYLIIFVILFYLCPHGRRLTRSPAPVAFKVYDMDRDGYISNGELFLVLKMMVGSNLKVRPPPLSFSLACVA